MILVDNIFALDFLNMRLSHDKKTPETVLVSHAHYDHLPTRFKGKKIVCDAQTQKVIAVRQMRKNINFANTHEGVQMLDAGHTLGSKMFYFKEGKILFTSDFRQIDSYCGKAEPKRCDTLIIDATFGHERYIFPKFENVVKELKEYLEDNPQSQIHAYTFGKAQEVAHLLDDMKIPFRVSENVKKINDALGLKYKYEDKKADIFLGRDPHPRLNQVGVSGWAIDPAYRFKMGLDAAFPFSNHSDFPSLLHFVKKCKPRKIFTFCGFSVPFAQTLRKAGYDSRPILPGQSLVTDYFG